MICICCKKCVFVQEIFKFRQIFVVFSMHKNFGVKSQNPKSNNFLLLNKLFLSSYMSYMGPALDVRGGPKVCTLRVCMYTPVCVLAEYKQNESIYLHPVAYDWNFKSSFVSRTICFKCEVWDGFD